MVFLVLLYFLCNFLSVSVRSQHHYKLDTTWSPQWPSSSAIHVSGIASVTTIPKGPSGGEEVHMAQETGSPSVLVFDTKGRFLRSWGEKGIDKAHGLKSQQIGSDTFLWLTDMGDGKYGHTVKKYSLNGTLLLTLGTPGKKGNGTDPIQFGTPADIAFDPHGNMFVSDGDGEIDNRVVKFNSDLKVEYIIDHKFNSPHSVAYDQWDRIWVADRKHEKTQVFDGLTGKYIGSWTCTHNATRGSPWGLRILGTTLFVVDGVKGGLVLFSLTGPSFSNTCHQIQVIPINSTKLGNPHELCIDPNTKAVYVAELGAPKKPTGCQRFVPVQ